MKSHFPRVVVFAFVVALSLPSFAGSARDGDTRTFERRDPIVRFVDKVRKVLRVVANGDLLTPPVGAPKP
jgi:hypothetical protein